MIKKTIVAVALGLPLMAMADIFGTWKTIDDETGEAKSWVEVYQKDGKVYGKVVKLLNKPADTVCKECEGKLKNQPIVGMEILQGLSKKDDAYEGGKILDPAKGKWYKAKIWQDEENASTLNVRGYVAFFFRTQQWHKVEAAK